MTGLLPRESSIRPGKAVPPLRLRPAERLKLEQWAMAADAPQVIKERAAVILACASDKSDTCVAREIGWARVTVGFLRRQFLQSRLVGFDRERRGRRARPIILTAEERETLERRIGATNRSDTKTMALAILACFRGSTNTAVANSTGLSRHAVSELRERFLRQRLSIFSTVLTKKSGRPIAPLILQKDEKATLRAWTRLTGTPASLRLRAKIVLLCGEGNSIIQVAREVGVAAPTVARARRRFLSGRLEGFAEERRGTRKKQRG
jgi:transposase-like protein